MGQGMGREGEDGNEGREEEGGKGERKKGRERDKILYSTLFFPLPAHYSMVIKTVSPDY